MMKAFGSCPPEYRIMAVWIFIFLTLLYMILLICEGTGERKKKAMLQDSLLLIAAFLITSGLCVLAGILWRKGFHGILKNAVWNPDHYVDLRIFICREYRHLEFINVAQTSVEKRSRKVWTICRAESDFLTGTECRN